MRKHDVRKWIHAILDLLPLIILPAFMIYSHRHDINTYQVTREESILVDFNQQYNLGRRWSGNLTDNNDLHFTTSSYTDLYFDGYSKYYVSALVKTDNSSTFRFGFHTFTSGVYYPDDNYQKYSFIADFTNDEYFAYFYFYPTDDIYVKNINIINLTTMFGSGNEPTLAEFNSYFDEPYYDYVVSKPVFAKGVEVTYDDTDIGSQMLYSLYNVTDKYFNFNKVFNFDKIYDWFQLNIFHGTAPLSMSIAWNVFLYEFLMDLMFLLYGLFMFFVDFCTNLIDRFHTKCSGGK